MRFKFGAYKTFENDFVICILKFFTEDSSYDEIINEVKQNESYIGNGTADVTDRYVVLQSEKDKHDFIDFKFPYDIIQMADILEGREIMYRDRLNTTTRFININPDIIIKFV